MIKTNTLKNGLVHTYSTTKHTIKQIETGVEYDDAYDLPDRGYAYEETENYTAEYQIEQRKKMEEQLAETQQEESDNE